MQQKFFDLLLEENKKGATVLLSSHILSEVQRLCDRVAIIKDGRIVKVEKISTLKESNYKRFKCEFTAMPDANMFSIDGVENLTIDGNVASFLFRGDVNKVVRMLATLDITDIWAADPDLEEIFMHYYEKEA